MKNKIHILFDKTTFILRKIFGIATGKFSIIPNESHCFHAHIPFTPKRVFIDYEVTGIGCVSSYCDVCVEKTWHGFVVYYMTTAEKVEFSWIATRF